MKPQINDTISIVEYWDWHKAIEYWKVKVVKLSWPDYINIVAKLTTEEVDKILDYYYPEHWETPCIIKNINQILNDK